MEGQILTAAVGLGEHQGRAAVAVLDDVGGRGLVPCRIQRRRRRHAWRVGGLRGAPDGLLDGLQLVARGRCLVVGLVVAGDEEVLDGLVGAHVLLLGVAGLGTLAELRVLGSVQDVRDAGAGRTLRR